jgi:hypothetical protein
MYWNIYYDNKLLYEKVTDEERKAIQLTLMEKVADGAMDITLINMELV